MKTAITHASLVLLCLCGASCTVMTGNGTGFTYASLGGNAEQLNITPTGATAAKIDNATGAAIAKEAISDAASAYVLGKAFDAAGKLIEEGADAIEDANDTDEAIAKSNNATKAEIETFVPPEPVAAPQ
jgi:hypothetical protein